MPTITRTTIALLLLFTRATGQAEWWFGTDTTAAADSTARASIRASYERNPDYGYTLAAFNAIESAGGQFTLAVGENSGGRYALRGKLVAAYLYDIPMEDVTAWQESRVLQWLVTDRGFDDRWANYHLGKLHAQYDGDWMKIWQAWNGHLPGQAEMVRAWVRFFKRELRWRR